MSQCDVERDDVILGDDVIVDEMTSSYGVTTEHTRNDVDMIAIGCNDVTVA